MYVSKDQYSISLVPLEDISTLAWEKQCGFDQLETAVFSLTRTYKIADLIELVSTEIPIDVHSAIQDSMKQMQRPNFLCRKLFSHYYAGPSGGYREEYKTLYRIRLRFFWPKLCEDTKQWVNICAHCIAYNVWRNRRQELHLSWPMTIRFYIMHLNIWSSGNVSNRHDDG